MLSPGVIPESLGQLTSLTHLFLDGNELVGKTSELLLMQFWHVVVKLPARLPTFTHRIPPQSCCESLCSLTGRVLPTLLVVLCH